MPLELRVEFTKMGRDDTLVRIIQGPYEPDVAGWHGEGWEKELTRLADYLDRDRRTAGGGDAMSNATSSPNMQHTSSCARSR